MQEISVYDGNGNYLTDLVQWDKDVTVHIKHPEITQNYNVHFFNSQYESALVVTSTYSSGELKAKIPNELLTQAFPITGYIYITKNGESKSLFGFKLMVRKRPCPSDYIYVESDDYISLEKVLDECRDYANSASGSATASEGSAKRSETAANNAKQSETKAAGSASDAAKSATDANSAKTAAANSADTAKGYEDGAGKYAKEAESFAHGGTGTRSNEEQDNAKYYSNLSREQANNSEKSAQSSENYNRSAGEYAGNASNAAADAATSASRAQDLADQVAADKQEIDETIQNSLLAKSEEIIAAMEDYFKRAEELYRSCTIVCDGEIPARRVRTIIEIDCHTPERRKTGYVGVDFDGGTPAIRLLGE